MTFDAFELVFKKTRIFTVLIIDAPLQRISISPSDTTVFLLSQS